ncbi:MAG: NADH:flavin oxidoreductase [Chloroflexi bacterium]|nr:NADH:flavin oxidoreductase [Chloroflexota bacterium]
MVTEVKSKVFTPGKIAGLELRNRVIRSGCFEGMSQEGGVTEALIEHHRRLAEGGIGMTTVAYASVTFDGRGFGHEIWMRDEIVPDLRRLTEAIHNEGGAASIQLGHCGFFASRREIGKRPIGASRKFCLFRMSICKEMTHEEINEKIEDYARSALQAKEAGFDAVEIHSGHGYLMSQFLSPWTNHRKDEYGGSLENRLRFPAAIIRRTRETVGPDFPILVKMNQRDGFNGGLEIDDAIQVAKRFEAEGASALIPSCGFTARTPLYMMRGNVPNKDMARNQSNPFMRLGLLMFGRFMVESYPFEPMYLLEGARKIKDAVNIPVIYIGGVLSLRDMDTAMNEGFEFIEVGRATVRDPDFVKKLQSGEITESDCDHCNRCIAAMDAGGVHCVCDENLP